MEKRLFDQFCYKYHPLPPVHFNRQRTSLAMMKMMTMIIITMMILMIITMMVMIIIMGAFYVDTQMRFTLLDGGLYQTACECKYIRRYKLKITDAHSNKYRFAQRPKDV